MTKIRKITITSRDLGLLKKHKSMHVDKYLIKIDDSFDIPQVKRFG